MLSFWRELYIISMTHPRGLSGPHGKRDRYCFKTTFTPCTWCSTPSSFLCCKGHGVFALASPRWVSPSQAVYSSCQQFKHAQVIRLLGVTNTKGLPRVLSKYCHFQQRPDQASASRTTEAYPSLKKITSNSAIDGAKNCSAKHQLKHIFQHNLLPRSTQSLYLCFDITY